MLIVPTNVLFDPFQFHATSSWTLAQVSGTAAPTTTSVVEVKGTATSFGTVNLVLPVALTTVETLTILLTLKLIAVIRPFG